MVGFVCRSKASVLGCGLALGALLAGAASAQDVAGASQASTTALASSASAEPDRYQRDALYLAARDGNADLVQQLLQGGATLDEANRAGLTALHAAAARGHVAVAQLLLANCAEKDARDFARRTPLHLAVAGGHGPMVDLLLSEGADPVARRANGTTPLRAAERYRRVEVAERLRLAEAPLLPPTAAAPSPQGQQGGPLAAVAAGPTPTPAPVPGVLVPEARPKGTEATRRFVQEKLLQLGYDPGPTDGQLGGKTREAILAFQARIGQVSRGSELTRCLVDRLAIEAARRSAP